MSKIAQLNASEILDSRGNPTIEVTCTLEDGSSGTASIPSGASTGVHEALELRDGDMNVHGGLGITKAIESVEEDIFNHLAGKDLDQSVLDEALIALDGTENKSRLGANAILGVSLAFARAKAEEKDIPLYEYIGGLIGNADFKLPQPMFNVINGGKHAGDELAVQEFMLVPLGAGSYSEALQFNVEIYQTLKQIIKDKFGKSAINVGDEGGFAPVFENSYHKQFLHYF